MEVGRSASPGIYQVTTTTGRRGILNAHGRPVLAEARRDAADLVPRLAISGGRVPIVISAANSVTHGLGRHRVSRAPVADELSDAGRAPAGARRERLVRARVKVI